jgi:CheY-like chemotaxis protein
VALTANALSGNESMFLNRGFDAYISKPIDIMHLDMILNKWVRDVQTEETLRKAERRKADKLPREKRVAATSKHKFIGVPGVDFESGIRQYGGESTFESILRSFVAYSKTIFDKLEAPSMESLANYVIAIHGFKGASYGIFAMELGKLAEELEFKAKNGELDAVLAKNETFLQNAKKITLDLETYFSVLNIAKKPDAKERRASPDSVILARIRDAAKRYKTSLIENYMTEIERYEYDSGADLVGWLRQRVDELEYEAIVKRLEDNSGQGEAPISYKEDSYKEENFLKEENF